MRRAPQDQRIGSFVQPEDFDFQPGPIDHVRLDALDEGVQNLALFLASEPAPLQQRGLNGVSDVLQGVDLLRHLVGRGEVARQPLELHLRLLVPRLNGSDEVSVGQRFQVGDVVLHHDLKMVQLGRNARALL